MPVSRKAVLAAGDRVLLLRNPRGEWELPGGRPEPGERPADTVARELREETGLAAEVGPLVARWDLEVLPGRRVTVAAYGCRAARTAPVALSAEHGEAAWFTAAELDDLPLAEGYRRAALDWLRAG
jgi:8-oxo-dGTP pyrophosphatase MutT (NUDIX family)